jgi:hypothetical protein
MTPNKKICDRCNAGYNNGYTIMQHNLRVWRCCYPTSDGSIVEFLPEYYCPYFLEQILMEGDAQNTPSLILGNFVGLTSDRR